MIYEIFTYTTNKAIQKASSIKVTYLMSFFPFGEKIIPKSLEYMISHLIIGHNQALKFYSCIQPVPEAQVIYLWWFNVIKRKGT